MIDKEKIKTIEKIFLSSIELKRKIIINELDVIVKMGNLCTGAYLNKKKLLICGNGGSAADAQHLAAELLVRLRPHVNRAGIPAIPLTLDSSSITACANDYSYEEYYERMVTTLGSPGDVLLGITTSGNSLNVIKALKAAKKMKLICLGFLGNGGGEALPYCDEALVVPSSVTGRIQEVHITAGHALMELIEDGLLDKKFI